MRREVYKPKSRKPEKIVSELLAKSQNLVDEIAKTHRRHKTEIEQDDNFHRNCVDELDKMAVQMMMENGEPDDFNYDFHELRRTFLERIFTIDEEARFQYFLAVNRCGGFNLILKTIWSVESSIEVMYNRPATPTDRPALELYFFSAAFIAAEILKMYLTLADEQGIDAVLDVLSGSFTT